MPDPQPIANPAAQNSGIAPPPPPPRAEPPTHTGIDREFPCKQCGAKLMFAPGTAALRCDYCGFENPITAPAPPASATDPAAPAPTSAADDEIDFEATLADLESKQDSEDKIICRCDSCGAESALKPNVTSQTCAFCGTPIVAQGLSRKLIRPRSLLPFAITAKQAHDLFSRWLSSLWFAPGDLKKFAAVDGKLAGLYIPCWTYDARAITRYSGQRGDDYWTTETYTAMVNGKPQMRTRQVKRTRWTPVSGVVRNRFDDVLVPASTSLPHDKLTQLGDWDVKALVPYTDEYLSGFAAESYTIGLRDGFGAAKHKMEPEIKQTICADIGGDHQRVDSMSPRYSDITFKHILVPIWLAAYRYSGASYRFLVNGRTGAVTGDRPYSWRKITLAVIAGLVLVAMVVIAIAVAR